MEYDSDSSIDDATRYLETSTLLGYASKTDTGDSISHLGGNPTWIDHATSPSAALAKCQVCHDFMSLLLQLNGELPDRFPGHQRRLYVFSCRRKTCRRKKGSIRSIRATSVTETTMADNKSAASTQDDAKQPGIDVGATLFGVTPGSRQTSTANPFSSTPTSASIQSSSSRIDLFAKSATSTCKAAEKVNTLPESFASKLKVSGTPTSCRPAEPQEPWPDREALLQPYAKFYLDAEYETLSRPSSPKISETIACIGTDEVPVRNGKEDEKLFESTLDKTFQQFADRMSRNPEQVIRYEFDGQPILYSSIDEAGITLAEPRNRSSKNTNMTTRDSRIPKCSNCGADRVFEVQLTPHAITVLEDEDMSLDGMEWGTIIVAVCSMNCRPANVVVGEVSYVEEWTGVQWEG